MPKKDPRVDAYIEKSKPFAKPILRKLRALVHKSCPGVEETIKWSMPAFEYKGPYCGMAAFKEHCVFGFWKYSLIVGKDAPKAEKTAMGNFGRITSLTELPERTLLLRWVEKAAILNEQGIEKRRKPKPTANRVLKVPAYLTSALRKNAKALATFKGFSYSDKKEYVEWVSEAKAAETRARRLATAIEWMAVGRTRNWKYERK